MIFRRIASAVKRQDWTSVAIEFVLVVGGVFVALQVDTWAQRQAEERDYEAAIDRLRGEIAANLEAIEISEGEVSSQLLSVRRAFNALETCSDDPETRQTVNDGLALIIGTSGLTQRASVLRELTSSARLLAMQSPSIRRRLADLLFYLEVVDREARYSELRPLETRWLESIPVVSLAPGARVESRYLGIDFSRDLRLLELKVPVSSALWMWEGHQSSIQVLAEKMREEYRLTLDLIDKREGKY